MNRAAISAQMSVGDGAATTGGYSDFSSCVASGQTSNATVANCGSWNTEQTKDIPGKR